MTAYAHLLLYFFFYSFVGWIWESCYVSILTKRLTNRGFLTGPMLPIYGSGAVVMLCATYPVQSSNIGIFLLGLIAATILEYVTGVVMETLFQVRYWDYSNKKYNIQGHICLSSSIAWGFLSLALIYGMHKPFEKLVLGLPSILVSAGALIISMVAAADFTASLKTALDIRDLIIQAERMRTELGHMKRRIEIIDTFARAELEEKSELLIGRLGDRMESHLGVEINLKERLQDTISNLSARVDALK